MKTINKKNSTPINLLEHRLSLMELKFDDIKVYEKMGFLYISLLAAGNQVAKKYHQIHKIGKSEQEKFPNRVKTLPMKDCFLLVYGNYEEIGKLEFEVKRIAKETSEDIMGYASRPEVGFIMKQAKGESETFSKKYLEFVKNLVKKESVKFKSLKLTEDKAKIKNIIENNF